ncbi:MAG: multidrug transporter ATP-binding protein [Clostridia bacterium]|nr:multidrug transporter ATP-binding protein [Clostridia bacterium]
MARNTIHKDEDTTQRSKTQLTLRLLSYLKPYKRQTLVAVALMVVAMICGLINPYLLKIAIDTHIKQKNVSGLLWIGVILIVINLLTWLLSKIRFQMVAKITNTMLVDIRAELYTHIQKLSFSFFDSRPVGKILARVIGDVNALQNLFSQGIQSLVPELLTLLFSAVFMFLLNVKLALACVLLLPFLSMAMFYIELSSRKRWDIQRKKRSNLNAFTHENFSGIKVVQAFARNRSTALTFKAMVSELVAAFIHAIRINEFFWPLVDFSWGIGTVVVFYIGYGLIKTHEIEIGTLLAFSMYVGMFWRPLMNLSNFYSTLLTNFSAADRIFDILDVQPDLTSDSNAPIMALIQGEVTFKDVCFSYDETSEVLKNVNFTVAPGERIALVGPTGGGKTTIVSLISRFYDPDSGEVLIDGKNIKDVNLESFRSQLGIMLQDTFLFSGTIMENIRYGKLDATDDEVIAAAKAVEAHGLILKMEKGYATEVNERGSRLSLGQRQLISFARALLANPRILILDEATSNIDTQTERLVQQGIEKLLFNRTSFVVAHRLSTIRDCDRIMVIDDLGIKENGTHKELMAQRGTYYDLYMTQYRFLKEGA